VGTDHDVLPPPEFERVAGGVAVVRLPSPGVEAVSSVASSVASRESGHLVLVGPARGVRRKGRHSSLALGSSPPPGGRVVGEVQRAEAVARSGLRTSQRLEMLEKGRRDAAVERMMVWDGLSTQAPEAIMVLAEGKRSRHVS